MASLCILDTGFLKTTHASTQLSTANRANSGSLIVLNVADFKPIVKANLDQTPTLGTFAEAEVHLVSVENTGFSLTCKLDVTDSTDQDLNYQLLRLARTRGYKAIFYNVDKDATDTGGNSSLKRDQQLVTMLANGHYDTTESQGDISFALWTGTASATGKTLKNVEHLHVRFMGINFSHIPGTKYITVTLNGVVTA